MQLTPSGTLITGKRVTLKPYQPRAFLPRAYMSEQEILTNAGSELIFDVECFPNYFMCGFKHVQTGKYIKLSSNDNSINNRFLSWLLFSYRTIGFNSINYDLTILWAAYFNQSPEFLKFVSNKLILSGKRSSEIAKQFSFKMFNLPERQHIDLFNVCPLKGSLKLYSARLHCKRIQDLPFPDDISLEDWQIPIVDEYNCNDLDNTELLFKFCKERLELRAAISIEYKLDLMSKSDAQMAEAVISQEVGKLNKRWVKRPEIEPGTIFKYDCPQFLSFATPVMQTFLSKVKKAKFVVGHDGKLEVPIEIDTTLKIGNGEYKFGIGGLHSKEECVSYKSSETHKLSDHDATSFYPNAIINLGLYPIAMGPNFLVVYKRFKLERVAAKRAKRFTEDKGKKIFLNGASGKFSNVWSKLFSPNLTMQMNLTCQLSILMLVEMLECNGIQVVSANTDGITAYYNRDDEQKLLYWIKYWENLTAFETEETEYRAYYARDVGAYFALKTDGTIKVKGPYAEAGTQSGTQLDVNPVMLICSDAIKALLSVGRPIETTIRECKNIERFVVVRQAKAPGAAYCGQYLGKVVRWIYTKNNNNYIQYVASGNKVANSDGAYPVMDLPNEIPENLDYDRYVELTNSILYDIGYLSRPKQINFF
jgi:hypothetical protein